MCVCVHWENEFRARPECVWLSWMLPLWEHPCGCWLERRGWEGKTDGPFSLKQASSTWSTCLPDARDRQRASAADLEGCVYSGKYGGQVPSLKAGVWLNLNEDIQQQTVDRRATASLCPLTSVCCCPEALWPRPYSSHVNNWLALFDLDVTFLSSHYLQLSLCHSTAYKGLY